MVSESSYSVEILNIHQIDEVHVGEGLRLISFAWDDQNLHHVHGEDSLSFNSEEESSRGLWSLLYERFKSMWKGLHITIYQSYIPFYGLGLNEDDKMEPTTEGVPSKKVGLGWEENDDAHAPYKMIKFMKILVCCHQLNKLL